MASVLTTAGTSAATPVRVGSESDVFPGYTNQCLLYLASPLVDENESPLQPSPTLLSNEIDLISSPFEARQVPLLIKYQHMRPGAVLSLTKNDAPTFMQVTTHGHLQDEQFFLAAETETGKRDLRANWEIYELFDSIGRCPPRVAVLNVCHSEEFGDVLVRMGIPHVVSIDADQAVLTNATHVFCTSFYAHLLDGYSVAEAHQRARLAVLGDPSVRFFDRPIDEYVKINLLPQNSNHDDVVKFEKGPGTVSFPPWTNTNLPVKDRNRLIGRNDVIWKLNERFASDAADHRIMVLHGFGGFGKTVISRQVARWQHERKWWPDGAWFIDARDLNSGTELEAKVHSVIPGMARQNAKCLVVLDDLDHLNEKDPAHVRDLLTSFIEFYPRVRVLVTLRHLQKLPEFGSHERLSLERLRDEYVDDVLRYYLRGASPWAQTPKQFVGERQWLIEFLSGYPLAIKLVASFIHSKGIALDEYRRRIESFDHDRLKLFEEAGESQDRDNNLRISLMVSYDAMPSYARDVYPLLAFFPSGVSEDLVAKVFGDGSVERDAFGVIEQFSMVEVERERAASDRIVRRFRLPEPARIFAEHLSGLTKPHERFGDKILDVYGEVVSQWIEANQAAAADLHRLQGVAARLNSPETVESQIAGATQRREDALNWLWSENTNIQRWIKWALASGKGKRVKACAYLMSKVACFWAEVSSDQHYSGHLFLEEAEQIAKDAKDVNTRAFVREALGEFFRHRNILEKARTHFHEALRLFKDENDIARMHYLLSSLSEGDEKVVHLTTAIAKLKESDNEMLLSACFEKLIEHYYQHEQIEKARSTLVEWHVLEPTIVVKTVFYRRLAESMLLMDNQKEAGYLLVRSIETAVGSSAFESAQRDINTLAGWGILSESLADVLAVLAAAREETIDGSEDANAIDNMLEVMEHNVA